VVEHNCFLSCPNEIDALAFTQVVNNTESKRTLFELRMIQCIAVLSLLLLISSRPLVNAQTKSKPPASPEPEQVIESGKFRIYELKQVQGEESYEITRGPGGLIAKAKFDLPFWGEELKPLLNVTLRMKSDLTPELFEIKGIRPLEVPIDTSVTVQGNTATVREDKTIRQASASANFFTLAGYAPVTTEMMLVRYWLKHHLKGPVKLLPAGEAFIEHRGRDIVTINGKAISLYRYNLSGSNWGAGWGRQTLWFDSENRLVAVVNIGGDLETNFSAIRDGYDSALPFFLKRTVEDGIDRLTQFADSLSVLKVSGHWFSLARH
jgi:hypothetical protein